MSPETGERLSGVAYAQWLNYRTPGVLAYTILADADIFEMYSENEKDCARVNAVQTK